MVTLKMTVKTKKTHDQDKPAIPNTYQAKDAVARIEVLRKEAAEENNHLRLILEHGREEAGQEKARLKIEAEALQKDLEATKKEFDEEKVRSPRQRKRGRTNSVYVP